MNLRKKLLVLFIVTAIFPLLSGILTIGYFYNVNNNYAKESLESKLDTAIMLYQRKYLEIEKITRQAANNNIVTINYELLLYHPISDYFSYFTSNNYLSFLAIIDTEGRLLLSSRTSFAFNDEKPIIDKSILKVANNYDSYSSTIKIDSNYFVFMENIDTAKDGTVFALISLSPIQNKNGEIVAYVYGGSLLNQQDESKKISSIIGELRENLDTSLLFVYEDEIISYSGGMEYAKDLKIHENLRSEIKKNAVSFENIEISDNNISFSFRQITISNSESQVFIGVGFDRVEFLKIQLNVIFILIPIMIISIIIAVVFAIFSAKFISEPILKMSSNTKNIINTQFKTNIEIKSEDEVSALYEYFNIMTEKLSRRILFDKIVADLSRKFISVSGKGTNQAINNAIFKIAKIMNADKSYIYFLKGKNHIINTNVWGRNIRKKDSVGKEVTIDTCSWLIEKIKNYETVFISDINQFPKNAKYEKKKWIANGLNFMLFVPLVYGKNLKGFWGFDFKNDPGDTIENDIKLIEIISEIITYTVEKNIAEDNIANTKNMLKKIFDAQTTMLLSIDRNANIVLWNNAIEKLTKISMRSSKLKKVWKVLPFLKKYETDISNVLINKNTVFYEKENIYFENLKSEYFINLSIIPLGENDNSGALIKIKDITELLKKDSQLIQVQKMETVRTLAGGLAHDFNNVIGAIVATVSFLQHSIKAGENDMETIQSNIEIIHKSARRAGEMIKHLVTLSRKHELSFKILNLNELVNNVVNICQKLLDQSVKIKFKPYNTDALVYADYSQIEQVILNLCINASHAMTIMKKNTKDLGGILNIEIEKKNVEADGNINIKRGEYYLLKVSDNGVGMSKKTLSKIFDPFFTTKKKGKGTGLGLSMVLNIIKLHNGNIDVYSEENIGTTFNVFLPVTEDTIIDIDDEEIFDSEKFEGSGTILIIDDDDSIRSINKNILEKNKYNVLTAEDGLVGLETYSSFKDNIDLILLDMAMPVLSGDMVYEKVKKINPDVKILLTSGFEQDERVQKLIKKGISGFLKKPFTMKDLLKKVKEVLG